MTIKRRIQWYSGLLIVIALLGSAVIVVRSSMVQQSENQLQIVAHVMRETMMLADLTQNYVKSPSASLQSEWLTEYETIGALLKSPALSTITDQQSLQRIIQGHNTIKSIFIELLQEDNNTLLQERLFGQITSHVDAFSSDSATLEKVILDESSVVRQRTSVMLLLLLIVFFFFAAGTTLYVLRVISQPIDKLIGAVNKIEKGDYSVQAIDTSNDEIGTLAKAFNTMVAKLSINTRALSDAKAKDEILVKDLGKRVVELEDSRRAMENLLQDLGEEQSALSEAKAKDDALLENIGDCMIAVDKNKNIIVMNRAAESALGLKRENVLGKRFDEVFQNKDGNGNIVPPEKRPIALVLATGKKFTSPESGSPTTSTYGTALMPPPSLFYVRTDGSSFPVSLTVSPVIINGEIMGAIDIFHDIAKEQEIEKLRVDFLALASHQLRTPLSGTKWLIETIRRGVTGETTPKQEEYLKQIYGANERMITLVSDMLDVLKLESGAMLIKRQRVPIAKIFDGLMRKEGVRAQKLGIKLTNLLEKDNKIEVDTDPEIVRLILECFVSNAMHYSRKGSEVVLAAEQNAGYINLSVKDEGIGIPKDEQGRIFERFYRASNAKQFIPEGTGLGLYRVVLMAEKIGAKISFNSEEGKGSTFFLQLPPQLT